MGRLIGGGACGVLFLDLSKAFDTVDHNVIKLKLKSLGIKESSVSWFVSYLSNRSQFTSVDGASSDVEHVDSGVPQGSILGPLLFICYINDLPNFAGDLDTFLYADDTALLAKGTDETIIQNTLQNNFNNILNWLAVNKLSLNANKTKVMLFCSNHHRLKNHKLHITIGDTTLEQVDNLKYLGVYLDTHLSFDNHIDKICGKISQRTRLLWKMRSFIMQDLARYLYLTLINPVFSYCDFIYDGTSETNKHKLQVKQNDAMRAIARTNIYTPINELHERLEIDSLSTARYKSTLKIVYRGITNAGPPELNSLFEQYIPHRSLRSEDKFTLIPMKYKLKFCDRDIAVRGCHYWNPIPMETKQNKDITELKLKLKKYGSQAISC